MTCKEEQEEEIEVLRSIYDGDERFKEVSDTVFQYKVGEDDNYKSFLIEVVWGETYPEDLPEVNLDAFYNKHIINEVKKSFVETLNSQAEDLVGCAMTYTLFEYAKENAENLMENQPDAPPQLSEDQTQRGSASTTDQITVAKVKEKKEHFTKAQKRKMYSRLDNKGELPRGHDWVDIIRHLSKTGEQAS